MRSKSLLHINLLILRASAALVLTVAPFHLSFDGALPMLAAAVAMADDDGGSESDGDDSDGGDSNDGDDESGDDDDDDSDDDGDDSDSDEDTGDDSDDDDSAEGDQSDDSTVAAAILNLFK